MSRSRLAFLFAAILACPADGRAAPVELPPDLDLVPRDAAGFVHVRAGDLWKADWMADVRRLIDKAGPEALKTYTRKFAPDPATIDRVTLVMMTPRALGEPFPRADPEAVSAIVIVTTSKPYDRLRVMQALGMREKLYRRHLYYFNEDLWSGLVLIDNTTFLIGSEDALVQFVDLQRAGNRSGPLLGALREAAGKHQLVIGLNPQLLGKEDGAKRMPPSMQKLLEASCTTIAADLDKEARLTLRSDYDKEDGAEAGAKALRETFDLGRMGLASAIEQLEAQLQKPVERSPAESAMQGAGMLIGLGLLREIDTLLKEAPIRHQGSAVTVDLTYKGLQTANTTILAMMGVTSIGVNSSQTFRRIGKAIAGGGDRPVEDPQEKYLKKLAAALDKYQQDKGTYPAPAIYDKEGRPLLSWRVDLLPYLGEETLYKEFHLDEPWDSLHNKKLLKKMPKALQSPEGGYYYGGARMKTGTLVFTGEATIFSAKKGTRKTDVGGGAVLLADADADVAVYWSKPADFTYADGKPLPRLASDYGTLKVMLADGTFRTIDKQTAEKTIRAMVKRAAKSEPKEPTKEPKK